MRYGCAALVVLATACGDDPSLRVEIHHPDDVEVATTTLTVYESDAIHCDAIQFGDLTEDDLLAVAVAEVTFATGAVDGTLDGLSRTRNKLIVARGYGGDRTLVAAGCVEKALVVDQDVVEITTDKASIVSIGQLVTDGSDPFSLAVSLTDARGVALDRSPVSWRVHAPAGAVSAPSVSPLESVGTGVWQLAAPTCTNSEGVRKLHPVPPTTVGGFAVQVRPSWSVTRPPLVTAFTRFDPGLSSILRDVDVTRPCAIRIAGTVRRLVCIERTSLINMTRVIREYQVTIAGGLTTVTKVGADHPSEPDAIALYAVRRGDNQDVYAVTARAKIVGVLGPSMAPPVNTGYLAGSETAIDAALLPACGTAEPPRLVLRTHDGGAALNRLLVMAELGSTPAAYHDVTTSETESLNVRGTGCLTELDPGGTAMIRQAAIVDVGGRIATGRLSTTAYFTCGATVDAKCFVDLPVPRTAAGFSPGPEPRLVGVSLDASGVVVSQWAVLPDSSSMTTSYRRVEFARIAAASVPARLVFGQFDADGAADVFWDIPNLDQSATSLQITYATKVGDTQLSALALGQPILVNEILVGDVTGDAHDDLLLLGAAITDGSVTVGSFGVAVIPSQVAAQSPGITRGDDPCP